MQLTAIQNRIFDIRNMKVMLDFHLAELYEVETKRLKEAVRRNKKRFPPDFMFQLTKKELDSLRTQFATLNTGRGQHSKYLPYAFTEQGVAMLSSVLNSDRAIEVNIAIIRTFVLIRQHASDYKELEAKIKKLEKKYNQNFTEVFTALGVLLGRKQQEEDFKSRRRIGFKQD
ncbi:MAG: ORF6N domain-containing protein [Chitinophagaceae bacterium]